MLDETRLLFGAFFDALIGVNLFVAGEPFLIASGYQLYHGGYFGVATVVANIEKSRWRRFSSFLLLDFFLVLSCLWREEGFLRWGEAFSLADRGVNIYYCP